jgi:histone arginine demethylase JMJD6
MASEEPKISHRSRKRIKEVKRKARPGNSTKFHLIILERCNTISSFYSHFIELSSTQTWNELNYAKEFEQFTQFEDNVERVHAPDVDCQEFIDKYEKTYKPVVITGLQEGWKAQTKWTMERLAKKYRNQKFKCGEGKKLV